jgi:DNA-binding response OmpR family regulator
VSALKVLVVDDEKKIVDIVRAYLEKDNFQVFEAFAGDKALDLVNSVHPDLVILDLMLPGLSGWDVCRELRKTKDIPIIMLTARDEVADKIIGLELGADDYITKPFNPNELISRVRAVLRRTAASSNTKNKNSIQINGLIIDIEKRLVFRGNKKIDLTATEFDLLKTMAGLPGKVFSRMQLLDSIQGETYEGYERTIDSHIKNLRKKIEANPDHPVSITTVHGVGYKMEDSAIA